MPENRAPRGVPRVSAEPFSFTYQIPRLSAPYLDVMLESLTRVNQIWLPSVAPKPIWLYSLYPYVHYEEDRPGVEKFSPASVVLPRGWGDCEDVAAWRAAELRVYYGEPATAFARLMREGLYHALVRRADGSEEDPSKILGMAKWFRNKRESA